MPYYLSPIGNNSQVSTSGAPLSSGFIYTYQAGTTTPVATYTDNTGGTPQANPIVLNTYGLPSSPIWMLGGQLVKFVIKDSAGNLIRTVDSVQGIDDPTSLTNQTEIAVASASTVDIGAAGSTFLQITGTTGISSFGTNYFGLRVLRFAAALTLTHNASTLVLPGGANITTAAGDRCVVAPIGNPASGWEVVSYQRASASPFGGSGAVLQVVTATDAGSSTSNASLTSVTSAAKSITPKSSNSTIVVRCSFTGQANAAGAGTNASAAFRLYNNTAGADIGISSLGLGSVSGSGTNATTSAPCCVEATVSNSALTAIGFVLRAQYTASATTVSGVNQQWVITEIQN